MKNLIALGVVLAGMAVPLRASKESGPSAPGGLHPLSAPVVADGPYSPPTPAPVVADGPYSPPTPAPAVGD
jgi:hypothetical protein